MEIKISPDEAVILCMKYFMEDQYTLKDISNLLNSNLKTVQLAEARMKSRIRGILKLRLNNYKIYQRREKISDMVLKGEVSVREFKRMGFENQDLYEEPTIFGIGEEDEHYEKRFVRSRRCSPKNSGRKGT